MHTNTRIVNEYLLKKNFMNEVCLKSLKYEKKILKGVATQYFHMSKKHFSWTYLQIRFKKFSFNEWIFWLISLVFAAFLPYNIIVTTFINKTFCRTCVLDVDKTLTDAKDLTFVTYANRDIKPNAFFEKNIKSWIKSVPNANVLILRNPMKFDKSNSWLHHKFSGNKVSYLVGKRTFLHVEFYLDDYFLVGSKSSPSKYTVFISPYVELRDGWFESITNGIDRYSSNDENKSIVIVGPSSDENGAPSTYSDFYLLDLTTNRFIEKIPPFFTSRDGWQSWLLGFFQKNCLIKSIGDPKYALTHKKSNTKQIKDFKTNYNINTATSNKGYSSTIENIPNI